MGAAGKNRLKMMGSRWKSAGSVEIGMLVAPVPGTLNRPVLKLIRSTISRGEKRSH